MEFLNLGADVVYSDLHLVRRTNQRLFLRAARGRAFQTPIFTDLLVYGNPLLNSSVVVRASAVRDLAGLSERADPIAIEDFDLWLKAGHDH